MVAATPFDRPLTFADIADLPNDGFRYELIWGELYMTAAPSTKHQRTVRKIVLRISEYVEQRDAGEVFFAPFDVHFDEFNVVHAIAAQLGDAVAGAFEGLEAGGELVEDLAAGLADHLGAFVVAVGLVAGGQGVQGHGSGSFRVWC